MLAFGYKSYSDVTKDIDMTTDTFSQLQSLVFCELQEVQTFASQNKDQSLLKACKGKIKSMYKLFFNNAEFESYAVANVLE